MAKQLVKSFREQLRCWPHIPLVFEIETITIQAKSRRLTAEYTVELASDLEYLHGIDAEEELTRIFYEELQKELDAVHHH